jgi:HEAT repeat protein
MSSSEHQFSDEELRLLVECLDGGSKAAVRKAVDKLVAAAAGDRRVAEILRKALVHERERVRWGAAYALGQIPNALDLSALSALFAAIASADGDVRWAAAELIVRLGRTHREHVRARILETPEQVADEACKMALYIARDLDFRDPEMLALAALSLRSEVVGVRLAALSLLGRIEAPTDLALQAVIRCLESDPDMGVRRASAIMLGRSAGASAAAAAALARAAQTQTDPSLRRAAARSLTKLGPER